MITKYGGKGQNSQMSARYSLASFRINGSQGTGGGDNQTSEHADNHGIKEGACHIYVALSGWVVCTGCSRRNRGRTKARLIGENTTGNTPTHGRHHSSHNGTAHTTGHGLRGKCHGENFSNTSWKICGIGNNNHYGYYHIKSSHNRHYNTGYSTNGANPLKEYHHGENNQNSTYKGRIHMEAGIKGSGNGVGLSHIANTKGSAYGKCRKQGCHGLAHNATNAIFHGIHWATGHFSPIIVFTILNSQNRFSIFGGKTKGGGNPHPHQSTRST